MQGPDLAKFEGIFVEGFFMEFDRDGQFGAVMAEDIWKTRGEHWMRF